MKVKLFSHTDLDGVGCVVVAKRAFDHLDFDMVNYDEIDQKVMDFIESSKYREYDLVLITDISVNDETAKKIQSTSTETTWRLIDHHPTAMCLNRYSWAHVSPAEFIDDGIELKTSGTSMLRDYLVFNDYLDFSFANPRDVYLLDFAETVRRYDTWEWRTKYNDTHPKQLSDLYYIIGRDKFIERFTQNANTNFSTSEQLILDIEQQRINEYIDQKEKQLVVYDVLEYRAGFVYGERYHSELGNVLATKHPELDFIVIANPSDAKLSYRGINDDIDLGIVAKHFGGGGHPKAAGSQLSKEKMQRIMNVIFE